MNHDSTLNQATSSASIVAVMASLEPKNDNLNPHSHSRRAYHARPNFTSRSLSQLPRFNQSGGTSLAGKEEMMALLRSGSRSTASSSAKSSTSSSSHSGHVSPNVYSLASTPSISSHKPSEQHSSPSPVVNSSADASSSLSPCARRKLLRSARKVGYLLGETPVLCTHPNTDSPDARQSMIDSTELGVLPSFSTTSQNGSQLKRMNSLNTATRPRPNAEMGLSMYDGLASAFVAPHQYTALSVDHSPEPFMPTLSRAPPVLRVDCSLVVGSSKHAWRSSGDVTPDADAQSFVSTTTTTTMASDLFSPTTARRSPISPIEMRFTLDERMKENMREMRRSKVAKLSRHLGEHVPPELVFPLDLKAEQMQTESFVLVSYEAMSPMSPLADKSPQQQQKKAIEPPAHSSSLRRRKRKSLELDLDDAPSTFSNSIPSTSSSAETPLIGDAPSKHRLARALSRSRSLRSRTRNQQSSSAVSCPSADAEMENVQLHPASAPAVQTVHESADTDDKQDKNEETKEAEPRTPLSDAQRALNVRRAQKMLSVFGEAPPHTLLPIMSKCESPVALGHSVMGGARFKRHSISSIMTSGSSFMMDLREPATFDSPVSPITPRPRVLDAESSVTPTRIPNSNNGRKTPSPLTPHRRASLSALPDTPPPFAQYFDPPIPPSVVSPSVELTPKRSRSPVPTHSPPTPSGSSASPPDSVSSSAAQEDPGAIFRERRLRAAKLARFFGVGYGDLYPVLTGVDDDININPSLLPISNSNLKSDPFDSMRGPRMESVDKEIVKVREKVKEREKRLERKKNAMTKTRVSITVQREVDHERSTSSVSSTSSFSLISETEENTTTTACESTETKLDHELEMEKALESTKSVVHPTTIPANNSVLPTSTTKTRDSVTGTAGCYGGLSFTTCSTPSRSASLCRRQPTGGANGAANDTGNDITTTNRTSKHGISLSFGLGTGVFSLGRQSRRTGSVNSVDATSLNSPVGSATLGRKGSTRIGGGGRALALGERRSILARSSCGDFGGGSANGINSFAGKGVSATDAVKDQKDREREMMAPRVRVGEKIADVNEVIAKLRELR